MSQMGRSLTTEDNIPRKVGRLLARKVDMVVGLCVQVTGGKGEAGERREGMSMFIDEAKGKLKVTRQVVVTWWI